MNGDISSLLNEFWHDLRQPDMLWQMAVLVLCLGLAFFADRMVRARSQQGTGDAQGSSAEGAWRIGRGGLRRLAFPLAALVLVALARQLLQARMHVHLLSLAVPLLGSLAIIRTVFYVLRHSFTHSPWLATFERVFSFLVWGVVALHIVGFLPDLIELLDETGFSIGKQRLSLWLLMEAAATVLATVLVAIWLGGLAETRLMAVEGLDANLRVVLARLVRAFLLLLAILIGLPLVGIDLTTLSVFGGAFGVGLGFGLQKIASSYVSGFIILLDRSIRIGNVIAVGGERGQVTQITTRYTVLRNSAGVEVIVPNEILIGSVVLNESLSDPRLRIVLPVQIAYSCDLDRAMRILCEAARAQARVLVDPPPQAFLAAFADSGINLEVGFWISDPEAGTLALRSEINLAIWRGFRAAGIEIPYPQREVRMIAGSVARPGDAVCHMS